MPPLSDFTLSPKACDILSEPHAYQIKHNQTVRERRPGDFNEVIRHIPDINEGMKN